MGKKRKRRSRYKKLSDAAFKNTGIPLSRLIWIFIGLIFIVGLTVYSFTEGERATSTYIELPTSQFDSSDSESKSFLEAVTIPHDFTSSPFPVRVTQLDGMIAHCQHLLTEDNDYTDKIKEKLIALYALKCVLLSDHDVDPSDVVLELDRQISQLADTEAKLEESRYLFAYVHMAIMAVDAESEFYDRTIAAIQAIKETTPAPPTKVIACYDSALRYYLKSENKEASGNLLRLLGEKMTLSPDQRVVDRGLALLDYPNFSDFHRRNLIDQKNDRNLLAETTSLMAQIQKTPPQATETYDLLLTLPEQHLQAGSTKTASDVLSQIKSFAVKSNEQIRGNLLTKIERLSTRVSLIDSPFPLDGADWRGNSLRLSKKKQTLIVFWDLHQQESQDALTRLGESRLYAQWSTNVILASVLELTDEEHEKLVKKFPDFKFLDGPTSKAWLEKTGINETPYTVTVNKDGIVERMAYP